MEQKKKEKKKESHLKSRTIGLDVQSYNVVVQ